MDLGDSLFVVEVYIRETKATEYFKMRVRKRLIIYNRVWNFVTHRSRRQDIEDMSSDMKCLRPIERSKMRLE